MFLNVLLVPGSAQLNRIIAQTLLDFRFILILTFCRVLLFLVFGLIKPRVGFPRRQSSLTRLNPHTRHYYSNMTESSSSSPLSLANPLDNLDAALAELTEDLIPGLALQVTASDHSDVDRATAEAICQALTEKQKGTSRTVLLGKMAVLLSAQYKLANQIAERALTKLKAQQQETKSLKAQLAKTNQDLVVAQRQSYEYKAQIDALEEDGSEPESPEGEVLVRQKVTELELTVQDRDRQLADLEGKMVHVSKCLDSSDHNLEAAQEELIDLHAKVRAYERARKVDQNRQQDLQRQLQEAKDRTEEAVQLRKQTEMELLSVKREMEYSFEFGLGHIVSQNTARQERGPGPYQSKPKAQLLRPLEPPSGPAPIPQASGSPWQGREIYSPRSYLPPNSDPWRAPTDRDLDKIARNITRFEPKPGGTHNTQHYLNDIEYYLRRFPDATVDDRIYLIKGTSSSEVSMFIERQPDYTRGNYELLTHALIEEFSDPLSQTGLAVAMAVKQGRQESPLAYYLRLRQAYFGQTNEPGMEEDLNFKSLCAKPPSHH